MHVDEPAHFLEFVADCFADGEHVELDNEVFAMFTQVTPENLEGIAPYILSAIVNQSGDRLLKKYGNSIECETLLVSHPHIRDMILEGSKNGYRKLRLLKLLRPEPVSRDDKKHDNVPLAPEQGWEGNYVGDAVKALLHRVQWQPNMEPQRLSRHFQTHYCGIVQSSGMGKSRLIDELSKSHFVIPVNLRELGSTGYPPYDKPAHDYLVQSRSQLDAFIRSCSFLHALFLQTTDAVRTMAKGALAEQFRNKMRTGMQRDHHGEWRTTFYKDVVSKAERLYASYSAHFPEGYTPRMICQIKLLPLRRIFQDLCKIHKHQSKGDQQHAMLEEEYDKPCFILAFDEVHTLTKLMDTGSDKWSRFGEIRRAIRLVTQSLFTIFLSSSGAMFSAKGEFFDVPPFYELGFDQLAVHIDLSQTATLSQITSEEYFTSYGRSLWRPHFQSSLLMQFAAKKLLGGIPYTKDQPLTDEQKLACLAWRIPIEFLSARVSKQELDQVCSHMRVILKADDGFETVVTTSPSEPILSEAAYFIMTQSLGIFNPPRALQDILNKSAAHQSNLKELIVALMFTMARDDAVGPAGPLGPPLKERRWCSLTGLLTSLFRTPHHASKKHVDIHTSHGWHFTPDGTGQSKLSLDDRFKDSKVYFTHFTKVHEQAIVELNFLMRLMVRGAAILCADGQPNINGIVPFLLQGNEIKPDNIGVIMFQVGNDAKYTDSPQADLIREMDPHLPGIIHPFADVPIIRLFFALSADVPTLQRVEHDPSCNSPKSYTAYDFWTSGLSPKNLRPVVNEEAAWENISQISRRWQQVYSGGSASGFSNTFRKSMNPGVATGEEFWKNWCENVPH